MTELRVETTPIPGLLVVRLPVHGDSRGWFKENWQREKMTALGLPDFGPVQNNISYNDAAGVTRGIHAEPWDKFVSVASGRIFGAWVDLREGPHFGTVFTLELGPETAVFVPRGVGNAYQTLEDRTAYTYLVNDHWTPQARDQYTYLNLADETAAIVWPIPLDRAELSDADRRHPRLAQVTPAIPRRTLVLGGNGQLGRAVAALLPGAHAAGREQVDLTDAEAVDAWPWGDYDVIVNAAAHTKVDAAETPEGRRDAWAVNAHAVARLVAAADRHRATLVHVSTDYVFDGTRKSYTEDDAFAPLGVYGQSKAAGDLAALSAARHYLLRTSWVIGDGHNFVRTMAGLADRGIAPSVVDDQHGRLTFTTTLAEAIAYLLRTGAPYGTYNVTNAGPTTSWCDVAREVFRLRGRDPDDVTPVTTEEYAAGEDMAPRPRHSTLELDKIEAAGYRPADAFTELQNYVASL